MLSPSEIVVMPARPAERFAAEVPAAAPTLPEPTPTTMAERFAPEAQKGVAEAPGRPLVEPVAVPGLIPERRRTSSANRWLLLASILVSLVPTALILALLWQGAIRIPGSNSRPSPSPRSHSRLAGQSLTTGKTPAAIASRSAGLVPSHSDAET